MRSLIFIEAVQLCDELPSGPVDILVEDGVILAVAPHGRLAARGIVIDGRDRLAVPGYINSHVHSHELFFRGRSERQRLEEWMVSVRPMTPIDLEPEDVYLRTLAVASEALLSGTTTICDDVGVDLVNRPDHVEAIVSAYRDSGIRAFIGPTLFDVPFARAVPFAEEELCEQLLKAVDDAFAKTPAAADQLAAFARFAATRNEAADLVGAIAAPSAPQRCSERFLLDIRATADALSLPVMIHVQETQTQAATAHLTQGESFFSYLDRIGFLKPRTSLIHATWVSPDDLSRIAASGATIQHNPASNLKLGSGVAPVRAMLAAGINVSLASDGCGSIETVKLQPNVALAALLSTLRNEPDDWLSAAEAFKAATTGGAAALGLAGQLGVIAPGHRADIVLYRLDRAPFHPLNSPLRQLVYAESGANVDTVLVDGRLVCSAGRLTLIDEAVLHHGLGAAHRRLAPALAQAAQDAARFQPAMRRIACRCSALPLPEGTLPARFAPPIQLPQENTA